MGEIRINIPADMARKLEQTFPDEDKGEVLLRLAEAEIRRRETEAAAGPATASNLNSLVDEVLRLRRQPPFLSDDEVRTLRREGRP